MKGFHGIIKKKVIPTESKEPKADIRKVIPEALTDQSDDQDFDDHDKEITGVVVIIKDKEEDEVR